jgi:hypothetical protein
MVVALSKMVTVSLFHFQLSCSSLNHNFNFVYSITIQYLCADDEKKGTVIFTYEAKDLQLHVPRLIVQDNRSSLMITTVLSRSLQKGDKSRMDEETQWARFIRVSQGRFL